MARKRRARGFSQNVPPTLCVRIACRISSVVSLEMEDVAEAAGHASAMQGIVALKGGGAKKKCFLFSISFFLRGITGGLFINK